MIWADVGGWAAVLTGFLAIQLAEPPAASISNMTATAVLGWYAWHTASRAIPRLMHDFRTELAAIRADYLSEGQAFRIELQAERQQRHEDHLAMVMALNELGLRLERWTRDQETGEGDSPMVGRGEPCG